MLNNWKNNWKKNKKVKITHFLWSWPAYLASTVLFHRKFSHIKKNHQTRPVLRPAQTITSSRHSTGLGNLKFYLEVLSTLSFEPH